MKFINCGIETDETSHCPNEHWYELGVVLPDNPSTEASVATHKATLHQLNAALARWMPEYCEALDNNDGVAAQEIWEGIILPLAGLRASYYKS